MIRTVILLLVLAPWGALAQQTVIKLGTLAPDGSPWHQILLRIGERWRDISGGKVKLVIYPGGALGDEQDMVKKMRINQLQAVAVSGVGLGEIEKGVSCLQVPMLFGSYAELDYVRERMAPRLEKSIQDRGYQVLGWADVGWVHFFTKTPVTRIDDLRRIKLFTWAGDTEEEELWKTNGFRVVPLAATDILTGLQTGLIEAVPTTPLYALLNQCFGLASNMTDIQWAPLIGATVVKKSVWDTIPEPQRQQMLDAAIQAGDNLRGGIRKMNDDAVAAMQKRKLNVVHADAAVVAEWRKQAEAIYPKLRGRTIPADLFDEVRRLHNEFQARQGAAK